MHLWVSRDGGGSWHDSPLPFDAAHVAVLTDGSGNQAVLVETSSAVQRTDDDGATWRAVGQAGTPAVMGGERVAVAGGHDYVLSGDASTPVAGSGGHATDLSFASSATNSTQLLAAADPTTGSDLVERCDAQLRCGGGAPLPASHSADVGLTLDSDFDRDGIALARTTTGLFRTRDSARTFTPVALPQVAAAAYMTVAGLATTPASRGPHDGVAIALLAVIHAASGTRTAGGVYGSDDLGTTWQPVGTGGLLDGGATAVALAPDGRVFAGYLDAAGGAGLACSDGGAWQAFCTSLSGGCTASCVSGVAGTPSPAVRRPAVADVHAAAEPQRTGPRETPAESLPSLATTDDRQDGGPQWLTALAALAVGLALLLPLSTLRRRAP